MVTLQDVLDKLEDMGIDPSEVRISRAARGYLAKQAREIIAAEEEEGEEEEEEE